MSRSASIAYALLAFVFYLASVPLPAVEDTKQVSEDMQKLLDWVQDEENGDSKNCEWEVALEKSDGGVVSKCILADPDAQSVDPELPAFLANSGKKEFPVYYGYPIIQDTCKDGYCYGAITDFLDADTEVGCTIGDGFVQAPDGTRAGITWEVSANLYYSVSNEPTDDRWGVYYFGIEKPIASLEDLVSMFHTILPALKRHHIQEKSKRINGDKRTMEPSN